MDYAFAPDSSDPKDPVPAALRTMFSRRANTTLIAGKKVLTVRDFVTELNTLPVTDRPIGNTYIGSHANSEGQMFLPLFPGQADPRKTSYETLEASIGSATKSVRIDDTTIGWTTGAPIDHAVHFKGCNLGQALPYLTKFKEVLGNHVILTAPRHFHGVTPEAKGSFEYMCYEFSVRAPKDFTNRAALLTALSSAGFKDIHGTAVPAAAFDAVVPKKIGKTLKEQVRVKLGATAGGTKTILVPQQFRVDRIPLVRKIGFPTAADIPASKADRESELAASLTGDPLFSSSHAFPKYERVGYASLADLIAGYTWTFTTDFLKKDGIHLLVCTGNRAEYTVVMPVLGATGNLLFNFYPDPASGLSAVTTGVVETDSKLFAQV